MSELSSIRSDLDQHKFIDFVSFVEERFGSDPKTTRRLLEMRALMSPTGGIYSGFEDDSLQACMLDIGNPNSYEVWMGGLPLITTLHFTYSKGDKKNYIDITQMKMNDRGMYDPESASYTLGRFCDVEKIRFSEDGDKIIFLTANKEFGLSRETGRLARIR